MLLTIHLPDRENTLALVRKRWEESIADPYWSNVEGKFESNSFGQIIVTPPPPFFHNDRAYRIARQIEEELGGRGRTEVPVLTIEGTKVPDAAWFSQQRYESVRGSSVCEIAPEICVEVVSASNTDAELQHKRTLYFDSGAIECWQCDLNGQMAFYSKVDPNNPQSQSKLCPNFPKAISD